MLRFPFLAKRGSRDDAVARNNKKVKQEESVASLDQQAALFWKNDSSLNILVRVSSSSNSTTVLNAIQQDLNGKASVNSETVHREVELSTLDLDGYRVVTMFRNHHAFSRRANIRAVSFLAKIHEGCQAVVYHVNLTKQTKQYLQGQDWAMDRLGLSHMLASRELLKHPKKPLLLLVTHEESEKDDDFDLDRIVTLLGLGRLKRPFRAVTYSKGAPNTTGTLKEALEWLNKTANSKDDESTAGMTSCDTEDDSSVVTSTSTAMSLLSKGGHYVLDYEPTLLGGNATLQWFEPIKKGTHCPFARAAKLWGGKLEEEDRRQWVLRTPLDLVRQVASLNAGPLTEFVARCNNGEFLDGFCLMLPINRHDVKDLGRDVCALLTQLADLDPAPGENAMRKMGRIDDPRWRFRFAGEDFFITTFSTVYKENSSRYAFRTKKSFVLFQPLPSFGRHGLLEDTPASATNWKNPTTMRDKARVAFKKNGCPYHIPEELPYPVAEHIVKPVKDDGTSCVRWWEPIDAE